MSASLTSTVQRFVYFCHSFVDIPNKFGFNCTLLQRHVNAVASWSRHIYIIYWAHISWNSASKSRKTYGSTSENVFFFVHKRKSKQPESLLSNDTYNTNSSTKSTLQSCVVALWIDFRWTHITIQSTHATIVSITYFQEKEKKNFLRLSNENIRDQSSHVYVSIWMHVYVLILLRIGELHKLCVLFVDERGEHQAKFRDVDTVSFFSRFFWFLWAFVNLAFSLSHSPKTILQTNFNSKIVHITLAFSFEFLFFFCCSPCIWTHSVAIIAIDSITFMNFFSQLEITQHEWHHTKLYGFHWPHSMLKWPNLARNECCKLLRYCQKFFSSMDAMFGLTCEVMRIGFFVDPHN